VTSVRNDIAIPSDQEREARVELAALHRLVELHGWGEGIYNHIALRVPGEPDYFLIKPHELRYDEVTASSLVKVSCRDDIDEQSGVNKVGFNTHAPIMRERHDLECSIHLHTIPIMAVAAMTGGLKMLNVQSVVFYGSIAYQDFGGVTDSPTAQQDLLEALGEKRVLILRNHGAVLTGRTIADLFASTQRFVIACELQVQLQASGNEVVEIPQEKCRAAIEIFRKHDTGRGGADWPAWIRKLDKLDPSFRD